MIHKILCRLAGIPTDEEWERQIVEAENKALEEATEGFCEKHGHRIFKGYKCKECWSENFTNKIFKS